MCVKYKYTIIIPHFNLIDLLPRALCSIPDRPDVQILVVDDNSGIDESRFHELNTFRQAECRFIFTKESKGAGYVRNVGLAHASGEWLLFLDADDFFEDGAFSLFDEHADSANDVVYFNTRSVYSESLLPSPRFGTYNAYIDFAQTDNIHHQNIIRAYHVVPVAKMIRSALVHAHNIRFDEVPWGNDVFFATQVGAKASKIAIEKTVVYVVTERENSLVKQFSAEALLCRYKVALRANQYLRSMGMHRYQNTILFHLKRIARCGMIPFVKALCLGFKYGGYNLHTLYLSSRMVKHILHTYNPSQR